MKKINETIPMVKDIIFSLSAEEQAKVMTCAAQIKKLLEEAGECGILALTLISAEMTDKS